MPAGPEELRHRLNVMRNAYIMLVLKFPGRADIGDVTHDLFERYKGVFVGRLCAQPSGEGLNRSGDSPSTMASCAVIRTGHSKAGLSLHDLRQYDFGGRLGEGVEGFGDKGTSLFNASFLVCQAPATTGRGSFRIYLAATTKGSWARQRQERRWQGQEHKDLSWPCGHQDWRAHMLPFQSG